MDLVYELLEFVERLDGGAPDALLDAILKKGGEITGASAGTAYLPAGGDAEHPRLRAVQRISTAATAPWPAASIPADSDLLPAYVARSAKSVLIGDLARRPSHVPYDLGHLPAGLDGEGASSVLCFPLTDAVGKVLAVLEYVTYGEPGASTRRRAYLQSVDIGITLFNRLLGREFERALMVERISTQNRKLRSRSRKLNEQRAQIAHLQTETEEAFQLSIGLLARAAEIHDEGTGNHIVRVNEYSFYLAKLLDMPEGFCDEIRYSAQLHDVGKMAVDSAVMKKHGHLTARDREEMNRHTVYGHRILSASDRLHMAAEIALNHHEKWDGTGYPAGKKGEHIPIAARIVQLADVYDALRSARVYKSALSHTRTCEILLKGDERIDPAGHFDPRLRQLFAHHHQGMDKIWRQFSDR
ncbi:MAG: HD-GYP domain-containing protein [Candidatus Eiseniibacteriota bacterium]